METTKVTSGMELPCQTTAPAVPEFEYSRKNSTLHSVDVG
jgi:hypothetical protein